MTILELKEELHKCEGLINAAESTRGVTTVWLEDEQRWQEDLTKYLNFNDLLRRREVLLKKIAEAERPFRLIEFRNNLGPYQEFKVLGTGGPKDGKVFMTDDWGSKGLSVFFGERTESGSVATTGVLDRRYVYPVDW